MRINKYLAACGVASRRNSEQFVLEGRVKINGKVVTDLATDVNLDNDTVRLDGETVVLPKTHVYLMMNKPKGVVCTVKDDKGRRTVMDLLPEKYASKRLFPIGRLDYDSEGLLLLTDDGDLSDRLMRPSNEIPKTYVCRIEGTIAEAELAKLRNGVMLDGVKTKKCKMKVLETGEKTTRIEVTITEGKNRQIRRMFESVNKQVTFLKRVAVGTLRLGGLTRSTTRELHVKEIEYLKKI